VGLVGAHPDARFADRACPDANQGKSGKVGDNWGAKDYAAARELFFIRNVIFLQPIPCNLLQCTLPKGKPLFSQYEPFQCFAELLEGAFTVDRIQ
jgi:hypothetical protein